MIRILHMNNSSSSPQEYPASALPELLRNRLGLTWLDLAQEPPETAEPILRDLFGFHPLAIQDALHETHVAKLDQWEDYLYMVLHGPLTESEIQIQDHPPELDIFFGKRFLITHHHVPIQAVDLVWQMCIQDVRLLKGGADHLVFRLSQELLREHFRMLEELEDRINHVEDRIFTRRDNRIPGELFTYKRILLKERTSVGPMRDLFHQLSIENLPVVDARDRIFFRDIYEQINRLDGSVSNLRDLVSGILDAYLSVVNNRLSDTMRLMAVITTLFMPITFITGFFGMNFFQAVSPTPAWTGTAVLAVAMGCMLLVPIAMFLFMKRRGLI